MTGFNISCPIPLKRYPTIVMGHGSGGQMTNELIEHLIAPAFGANTSELNDSAVYKRPKWASEEYKMAVSTDSFVINPVVFPGGDIGSLAVHGTVNDLAMSGAKPDVITASFILEEGLDMKKFVFIVESMAKAAKNCDVKVIAGDTKVVQKGSGDEIYINTTGIGWIDPNLEINPKKIQVGDALIINGSLGDHGMAIMSVREGLEFETNVVSDSSGLNGLVEDLILNKLEIRCMRDLTRGGLAAATNEIAQVSKKELVINEEAIPVKPPVRGACEILGMDVMSVANEGKMLVIVADKDKEKAIEIMKKHKLGKDACIIGEVSDENEGVVVGITTIGSERVIDLPPGELLPRIC